MNHQAKIVNNESIVVYFSLHELSQSTGVPIKELMKAIGDITGPSSGLAYVSVINRSDAKKHDRDDSFFPLLNEAKFTANTGLLKLDISRTIISCKITLINTNTPRDHLLCYQEGIVKGEYTFVPRLLSNGRYLYPKPHDQFDPEADREEIQPGSVSIIGFDLLFNDNGDGEEYVPVDIKERIDEMFPGVHKDISEDHFRRHAPQYSIQPLYPAERQDPNFTPTPVGRQTLIIDLDNPEELSKLQEAFTRLNGENSLSEHLPKTDVVQTAQKIPAIDSGRRVMMEDFIYFYLGNITDKELKEAITKEIFSNWEKVWVK